MDNIKDIRSAFGLASKSLPVVVVDDMFLVVSEDSPLYKELCPHPVLEGGELFDTLCPVSKNTGKRESPLSLLGKITGANSALLNSVLSELPTIASDPRLTDEDRVATVVERLSTGSPAEDALMAERLMKDIDVFGLRNMSEDVQLIDQKIQFDAPDVPNAE